MRQFLIFIFFLKPVKGLLLSGLFPNASKMGPLPLPLKQSGSMAHYSTEIALLSLFSQIIIYGYWPLSSLVSSFVWHSWPWDFTSTPNAASRLIARFTTSTHNCFHLYDWSPTLASDPSRFQYNFKTLLLVAKSQLGLALKYLTDFMRKPIFSTSARALHSTDRLDMFPRGRTALVQWCAFEMASLLYYDLRLYSGISATSCRFLKTFFPRASALETRLWIVNILWDVFYKINV